MEVIELLEYLQDVIENSPKFIVPNKVVINKSEVMELIDRVINFLPDEFKKAKWLCEEKDRILGQALQEAEILKKEKMSLLKREIENHSVTKQAEKKAENIVISAQKQAKELRLGAIDYADFLLSDLQNEVDNQSKQMLQNLQKEMEEFLTSLSKEINEKNKTIRENIKELRDTK
ncbi:ATPase [Haloimpatiens massiliensis]|uniref:ATPase n=1 Tax=Haloimpatiens massiliensis TaxID=1658110 RepID=UPI000C834734|nr:ATPase [Haloimpatiens massiliensis]